MSESEQLLSELERRCAADAQPRREVAPDTAGRRLLEREPEPLFNAKDPLVDLKHEQPEHRIVTFLKAQGLSNKEIAHRTNYSLAAIGYILKQPWARRRLLREIEETGREGVHELLKGAVDDAVLTLIDIQADEKAKHSDRIAASNSILDRFFGKPTQRVESINTNVKATLKDVSKLQQELAEVDSEIARITGNKSN